MVGVGRAAQAGILIKNAEAIECTEKVTHLVTDKTGTLRERDRRRCEEEVVLHFSQMGTINFTQYPIEAQAQIVQDYFLLLNGGTLYQNRRPVTNPPPLQISHRCYE